MGRGRSCLSGVREAEGWDKADTERLGEVPKATGHTSSRGENGSAFSQALCLSHQVQSRILTDLVSHFPLHSPLAPQLKKVLAAASLGLIIPKPLKGREKMRTMRDPAIRWSAQYLIRHKIQFLCHVLTGLIHHQLSQLNLFTPQPDPARSGAKGAGGVSS